MKVLDAKDSKAATKELVERDAKFGAYLEQADHGVAGDSSGLADDAAGDFALGYEGADAIFPNH